MTDRIDTVGPWDEIDGDGTEASIIADHIRDLARLLAPPPGDGWWDTGHTSTACGCNHHWDAHTPFRGCSVCSCKLDPPNQPPPPGEPDEGEPHPWLCPHGATLLCMVCGDLSSGDNKEYVLTLCEALRVAVEAAENAHEELWHHDTRAAWPLEVALAAVRELVDLGEKP